MQGHYSRQLSKISVWLIQVNCSTCKQKHDPSEQSFNINQKSIVAQHCFTFDVVTVEVKKKGSNNSRLSTYIIRIKIKFFSLNHYHSCVNSFSTLYCTSWFNTALFQTIQKSHSKNFVQSNSNTHNHSCNPPSPQALSSFLPSCVFHYQEPQFNPCTKSYSNKSKFLFARLFV